MIEGRLQIPGEPALEGKFSRFRAGSIADGDNPHRLSVSRRTGLLRNFEVYELGREVVMLDAPSEDSNLKDKRPNPCGFSAVQCFQCVEIWLLSLDTFRTFVA